MDFPSFENLVKKRRSIRYFSPTPVTKEQVMQLLELAHLAPSVENTQPWHFHVIFNQDMRRQLMDACCYGNFVDAASVLIVVSCDHSVHSSTPQVLWNERELEYSCMAAMVHVILGATAMGLGSCWVSLHHGQTHEFLKLPRSHSIVGGVMLGNLRAEDITPPGPSRKPLEEMMTVYE